MFTIFSRLKRMDSVVNGVMELLSKATLSTENDQELIVFGKMLTNAIPSAVQAYKTPSWDAFADIVAAFDPKNNEGAQNDSIKYK